MRGQPGQQCPRWRCALPGRAHRQLLHDVPRRQWPESGEDSAEPGECVVVPARDLDYSLDGDTENVKVIVCQQRLETEGRTSMIVVAPRMAQRYGGADLSGERLGRSDTERDCNVSMFIEVESLTYPMSERGRACPRFSRIPLVTGIDAASHRKESFADFRRQGVPQAEQGDNCCRLLVPTHLGIGQPTDHQLPKLKVSCSACDASREVKGPRVARPYPRSSSVERIPQPL
jgi:hypothetical protein